MNLGILDAVSFLLFSAIFYWLSVLSRKLGEVMGMKRYYYFYYIAMGFNLSGAAVVFQDIENAGLYGYALFSIGLTCAVITAIKYWGWLFKEVLNW